MSTPTIRTEQEVSRRHFRGRETFYVELHRKAELNDELDTVESSDIEHVVIYLGDGSGETARTDGQHNLRVGITVDMAEWLQSSLVTALTEVYKTRQKFLRDDS